MILGRKDRKLLNELKEDRINLLQHLSAANQEIANLQLIINVKDEEIKSLKKHNTPRPTTAKRTTRTTNSTSTKRKKTE